MKSIPLAIVYALDEEAKAIADKVEADVRVHVRPALFTAGKFQGMDVLFVRSGMGYAAMMSAAGYLVKNFRPSFCLHTGFCGALVPDLASGDMVIATAVASTCSDIRYDVAEGAVKRAKDACTSRGMRFMSGAIATSDKLLGDPRDKAFLGTECSAVAVDMESHALACVMSENGIPFAVARAVFDPLDGDIPPLGCTSGIDGTFDGIAFAENVIKNPKDLLKIPRLCMYAKAARESIAQFIEAWGDSAI